MNRVVEYRRANLWKDEVQLTDTDRIFSVSSNSFALPHIDNAEKVLGNDSKKNGVYDKGESSKPELK